MQLPSTKRAAPTAILTVLLVAGIRLPPAVAALPELPATSPAAGYVIESVEVHDTATGAQVVLAASGPVPWAAALGPEGSLMIRLEGSRPGPGATDLEFGQGLVSAVELREESERGRPLTLLLVHTREAVAYSVSATETSLAIGLRSLRPSATAPAGVPVATPVPVTPAAVSSVPEKVIRYRIGAGDLLAVTVVGVSELDQEARVERDGRIALPLVGRIAISGLTVEEAEERIAGLLREAQLLNQPEVLVSVEEYASYGVSVQGAVLRPGVYQMLGEMTVLEVLGLAGGVSPGGAGQRIFVLRRPEGGPELKIEIDAARLLDEGDLTQNVTLLPGDVLMVPRARDLRVYVTGAVRAPGPVEFVSSAGITVLQAITAAGGPTERAKLSAVTVIRQLADGSQQELKVNVKKIRKGRELDLPLQNNDTVVVREWFL